MCSRVPKISPNISPKTRKMSSSYYLKKAKQYCLDNNYPEAYANFVNYFENLDDPSQSTPAIQLAFTKLVCRIGIVLEETDDTEELLKVYLQALNLFPNNYIILNNLGGYLFKIGQVDIARRYLDLAVNCSRNYLPAEKNLMHCKWQQMPRWHFRMLNDSKRNMAYYNAITNVVKQGFTKIVDIGAGCGLLSLIASQNEAAKITAFEENKLLAKMFESIIKENNVTNVDLINCYSSKLTEPLSPCNLLVTEIFDVALFGERMLESLVHAHTVLITENEFKIVPSGAKLYATAIACDDIQKKNRFVNSIPELKLADVCIRHIDAEPYDAEYIAEKNVKYMSDTQKVFDIDFYNLDQLTDMLTSSDFSKVFELKCLEQGWIHAFAVWFDLDLDENVTITTDPNNRDCMTCWEQGVFYLPHPVFVEQDEPLTVQATVLASQLKFVILSRNENMCNDCWFVSKDIITYLNDVKLVRAGVELAKKFPSTEMTIMDLNCFPLVGFLLAKQGCKVYTAVKQESDLRYMNFFDHILRINDIEGGKMIVLEEKIVYNPSMCIFHQYLSESQVCLVDPISTDGSLQQIILLKEKTGPKYNSIIMPTAIKVKVLLIQSSFLQNCNVVKDENVFNFKIAKFMNEYSGSEHPNLEDFSYTPHSSAVSFTVDEDYISKTHNVLVNKDGIVNGLYTWFEITYYDDITFSTLDSLHFKKSCYILQPKSVKLGDLYRVTMRREEAFLDFHLKE